MHASAFTAAARAPRAARGLRPRVALRWILALSVALPSAACDLRDPEEARWLGRVFAPREVPADAELALLAEPFPDVRVALATYQGQDRLGLFACESPACSQPEARALLDFTAPASGAACDQTGFEEFRTRFTGFQDLEFALSPASVTRVARLEHAGALRRTVLFEYAAPDGGCARLAYSDFERSYDSAMDSAAGSLHFNGFEFTRCPRGAYCAVVSEFTASCAAERCRAFVAVRFPGGEGQRAAPEVRVALAGAGTARPIGRAGATVDGAGAVRYRVGEIHGSAPEDFGFEAQFEPAAEGPAAASLAIRGALFAPRVSVRRILNDPILNAPAYLLPLGSASAP